MTGKVARLFSGATTKQFSSWSVIMEKKVLKIGDKAQFHKTVSETDVYQFAGLTGDYNRLHVDAEFAAASRFGQRIAHGLVASSFISTVLGSQLPGPGVIYLDQYVEFKNPVFFGDTITTEVEFLSYEEKKNTYVATFKTTCTNQRHELVINGTAHVMMDKQHFEVAKK